jgi:multidrug efflux pump subunit AcrA (membrane-fusion protein)
MGIARAFTPPYLPDFLMNRHLIATAALSALIILSGCQPGDSSGNGKSGKERKTTALVEQRSIAFSISVAGEIGPAEQVSVRPEVNGRISELPVDIGDKVKKGDLLFSLDDKDLQIELQTRGTEISSANLQIKQARQDLDQSDLEVELKLRDTTISRTKLELQKAADDLARNQQLFDAELISKEVMQSVTTQHDLAKNAVAQAESNLQLSKERLRKAKDRAQTTFQLATNSMLKAERNLELTQDSLSKTRITAPFDCTVLTRPISAVGQSVSGSGGFNSGTEVLTIANLIEMIIDAHVNQADITRLSQGMKVDVAIEAVIGLTVNGEVERIAPKATIRNGIKGFGARIRLTDIDPQIQPGMTAKISIPVVSAENALSIPLAAVFTEEDGRHVYVVKDGGFEQRRVTVGVSDYKFAEILSGLEAGETVALEMPPEDAEIKEAPKPADSKQGKKKKA